MSATTASSSRNLTLGTAGHIDHGKTTLVRALTGTDTDRLKEEKERGISIELGFAELVLPSGQRLSVVDVPGHERFVRTMVAGATGIDLFLLVVAADDGVMPQTQEHLRIIELLDVPWGVVALTKVDAVEPDMVALAQADVAEFLSSTRYQGVEVVPVSGVTGEGLPELLAALERATARVPPRLLYPVTRLPIDRVFSLKGIGTVVTGTLWSGELRPGDVVSILPRSENRGPLAEVRVRSVESHGQQVEVGKEGTRLALNLTGISRQEVQRGQWVVKNPSVLPTYIADVRLQLISEAPAPQPRVSRVRMEHGTDEFIATLVLVDRDQLMPGETGYAQLRLETPALLYPGDRFVLRSLSPVTTLGGGVVIDHAARRHGTQARWAERLRTLDEGPGEKIAHLLVLEAYPEGILRQSLEQHPYLWRFDNKKAVESLLDRTEIVAIWPEGKREESTLLFPHAQFAELCERVLATVKSKGESDWADPYVPVGELRRQLTGGRPWPVLDAVLKELERRGEVVVKEHGVRWAGAPESLEGAAASLAERLVLLLAAHGAGVPSPTAFTTDLGLTREEITRLVRALERSGRLVRVGEDLYYPKEVLENLAAAITQAIEAHGGTITLAQVRDLLGTSRRYAQALLEHLDSTGVTLRVGDVRKLRRARTSKG